MRILVDARTVDGRSDGMSNYVRHLVVALLKLDQVNEYILLVQPAFQEELASRSLLDRPGVRSVVSPIPFMGPSQHIRLPAAIRRLPRTDVYHYPHFDMPLLAHPRSVVTIFDLNQFAFAPYFESNRLLKRIYSFAATTASLAKARHIIAISAATKAHLLQWFPWLDQRRVSVVYFGLSEEFSTVHSADRLEQFRRRVGVGDSRVLLYVGTHRPHKNLGRLLEAYAWLRRHRQLAHKLLLAGLPTRSSRVPELVRALGLDKDVVLVHRLTNDELSLAYRIAEAFIYCSLSEGFGLPLLEAMASGIPVVTSKLGAMAEIVGDSGVMVDPYSVESIAEGIWRVLSQDRLKEELVARGRRRAGQFTWEACARQTLEIYARVAEQASEECVRNDAALSC